MERRRGHMLFWAGVLFALFVAFPLQAQEGEGEVVPEAVESSTEAAPEGEEVVAPLEAGEVASEPPKEGEEVEGEVPMTIVIEEGEAPVVEEEEAPVVGESPSAGGALSAEIPLDVPDTTHMVLMSARMVYFPGSILDNWFSWHANHWDGDSNMSFGAEYIYRMKDSMELQAGLFWTDLSMPSMFWLEADKEDDLIAADWTKQSISTLSAEFNIYGSTDFIPELGIYYGGGLWFGAVLGEIAKSNVDRGCAESATLDNLRECGHDEVFVKEDAVPPVAGFVNVATGLRFQLDRRVVARLEGGFRGYFYGGFSLGAQFF